MRELNTNEISTVSGGLFFSNAFAKLGIIIKGIINGDSWSTIGQNISNYFQDKYGNGAATK